MRRRIHQLASRDGGQADAALLRMVRKAPSIMALFDFNMRFLAISERAAAVNGVHPLDVVGLDYRPLFTEDLAVVYEAAVQAGFFTGDILGLDFACPVKGLNGDTFYAVANWHLVPRPSGGEPLLVWSGEHVDRATYEKIRADGALRLVSIDDWLNEYGLREVVPAGVE